LPLVVYWRTPFSEKLLARKWLLAGTAIAGLVALSLSLPKNARLVREARVIGAAVEERFGGYDEMNPVLFRKLKILAHVVPIDGKPEVPHESYGGSPLQWNYYAHHSAQEPRDINYVIQPASDAPPEGMQLLAQKGDAALYIADRRALAQHRALRPPTPAPGFLQAIVRILGLER
jgi:hypothetical protein